MGANELGNNPSFYFALTNFAVSSPIDAVNLSWDDAIKTTFGAYQEETKKKITIVKENGETVNTYTSVGTKYDLTGSGDTSAPITSAGDTVGIDILKSGQSIYGTYKTTFSASGDPDADYYKLVETSLDFTEGKDKGLKISVFPIEGHIEKKIENRITPKKDESDDGDVDKSDTEKNKYEDPTNKSNYAPEEGGTNQYGGDPIDLMTGGFVTDNRLMTVAGVRDLLFTIHYDSRDTGSKGDMGYGWYHLWESNIERQGQYLILHDKPGSDITFASENAMNDVVCGSYNEETGVITVSANNLPEEDYLPMTNAMKDYRIHRNAEGYQLLMPDGTENGYDREGRLIYSTNSQGQTIRLTYDNNKLIIEDEATGKAVTCTYTGDYITSVADPNGNKVSFAYDKNGNLVSATSKSGTTNTYTYDKQHRILTGTDNGGVLYVKNTYDEKGRVLTQDDGDESTPLLTLEYEDNPEDMTTKIRYMKVNGGTEEILSNSNGDGISYTNSVGGTKTYSYDYDGRLLSYRNADGYGCDYTRDEAGRILTQTDTMGKRLQYSYDEKGNQLSFISNEGKEIYWKYNDRNLVTECTENGITTTYTYNAHNQVLTSSTEGKGTTTYGYENGNISKITYPDGKSDRFIYDKVGNVVEYSSKGGYVTNYEIDASGRVTRETLHMADGTRVITACTYDAYGNPLTLTDANGNTTSYAYDNQGRLISETRADGSKLTYTYDCDGNVTSITYPDGTTTQTALYDTAGNLKKVVDTLKQTTTAEYSAASQLIRTIQADGGVVTYDYYGNGLLKSQTDAEGNTTTYVYDEAGRITSVTDPLGNTSTIGYDSYGNMSVLTDGEGNSVSLSYNAYGELVSSTDANGNKTIYAYDVMGNCVKTTDALGNVTIYTYDAMGQIISVTQKGKAGEDITIFYAYDALGNIISVTDGEGNTFRMTYDKVGNVTAVYDAYGVKAESYTYDKVYNQTSVTNANGEKTSYSYDSMGNKIKTLNESNGSVTSYSYIGGSLISAATDALGGKTSATYDSMGNLESFTNPNGGVTRYTYEKNQKVTSESVGDYYKVTYTYDAAGNVKTMTNSRGQVTTYEYDKAGRVIRQSDEAGTISYTYDANGNKLTVTENDNTITRTYDALNRVTSYTDGAGNTIKYSYDEFGNIVSMIYPDGKIVKYDYDKNGNVLNVTDWENRVTSYTYDRNGRLDTTKRPDGSIETRTYDKAGQLLTIKDVAKDGTIINDYSYTYDQSGNITAITDQSVGNKNAGTVADTATIQMEYDSVNRLIKYNGKEVRYDKDGNMTYGPLEGEMAAFTYDCRNRLTEVTTDGGKTTQYRYDADNNRVAVIKNAGTTQETKTNYVVDSTSNELTRVLQATTVSRSGETATILYTYGNGLIAQEKTEKLSNEESEVAGTAQNECSEYLLYHFNHIGSTTAVTDEAGVIKYTYTYSIYGELLSGNYGEVDYLYNGQYGVTSDDNGLYYMRARYYNIDIKRFINQDILTGSIDSSQSLNRYAYVEGNPVSYLDPFGLDEEKSENCILHLWYATKEGIIQGITGGGTVSTGYVISGAFGAAGSISVGITLDGNGNLAFQWAPSIGAGAPSASISRYYSYVAASSIDDTDLVGQIGGSVDVGPSVGFDILTVLNSDHSKQGYMGGTLYVGVGLAPSAIEGHGTISKSYNLYRINLLGD